MSLIVQKYGGTSVSDIARMMHVARKIKATQNAGHDVVVVVSAMGHETDRLDDLAHQIMENPSPRELDVLLATGEQVSIALLCMALHSLGCPAKSYTGAQVAIHTNSVHTKSRIEHIDDENIRADLAQGMVVVVAGFQGIDVLGNTTTLGRGGSDTTAVALAAALKADECQIYTDVDGVYTTDPRMVSEARRMPRVTFDEMLELSSLGAQVLQIRAVEFAGKYNVPLRVLSTFKEGSGTLITFEEKGMEQPIFYWDPSIAPSGGMFYTGDLFPAWKGNLFTGGLALTLLSRLELNGEKVTKEERLLEGLGNRVRDVRQAPDGSIWVLTDARNGKVLRLSPAN